MASRYAQHVSTKQTPQTEPVPGKNQVANNAGGFVFQVDDWMRLDRFLILGAEGGTYYVKERKLTQENAAVVLRCVKEDAVRTVNQIVAVSEAGRAPKNDPAIFAYALAVSNAPAEKRGELYQALPKVCRTGTHLFQFVEAVKELRGWGTGLMKAVGRWYHTKDAQQLAYQATKYQQRNGVSHRDVLRLVHRHLSGELIPTQEAVLRWVQCGVDGLGERKVTRGTGTDWKNNLVTKEYPSLTEVKLPDSIVAFEALKKFDSLKDVLNIINHYKDKAPRELIPTKWLDQPAVWDAMLPHMPMTAMIRNLGTMTRNGALKPLSSGVQHVCAELRNVERLKKARVHPLSLLVALKVYQQGKGIKSQGEGWTPIQAIVDALNDAFYLAFDAVEPSNKRWVYGLDVSASMSADCAGAPISCCEAATALALVGVRTEPNSVMTRFNMGVETVPIGASTRLDTALQYTRAINGGGTDCALPMIWAMQNKVETDVFCVFTDNETWARKIHPFQALKQYRQQTGIAAKLIVVGMASNGFSIADPSDRGMLDVVGLDTSVPAVMTDFARSGF